MSETNGQWEDLVSLFMQYSESARSSHVHRLWCAISMIGGALGRRVWVNLLERKPLYPNLYVLLVGPPGSGKSIIDDVRAFWKETQDPTGGAAFKVAPDNLTRASLIDELSKATSTYLPKIGPPVIYHSLLVASEEFQLLLPKHDPDMIATLNGIWNNRPDHRETRRHGPAKDVEIKNPQLNILGGMQPSYLAENYTDMTWNTGLVRRIIMVYGESPPPGPLFQITKGLGPLKNKIMKRLGQLSLMYGPVKWTEDAASKISIWHQDGGPPIPKHSKLETYKASRTEFVAKLALISAISRTAEFVIELFDVTRAIEWLIDAENRMPNIFRAMLGKSDASILDELHYFMFAEYAKTKKPIKGVLIYHFLMSRVTTDRIPRMIETAERANHMVRFAGTDDWIPRPKDLHGVE